MNVTCPNCATVYRVDPGKVPETGVRARCAVCSAVFAVQREAAQGGQRREPVVAVAAPALESAPPVAAAPAPMPPVPPAARPTPSSREPAAEPGRPAAAAPPRPAAPPAGLPPRPVTPPAAGPPARAPLPPAPPGGAGLQPAQPAAPPPSALRPTPPPAGARPVNPFLSQDPSLKARRLARALISDMVVYHPAKRQEGLRDGTLKELFEEEIKKSWEEYADQVGHELADSTNYFREALNEILAGGRQIF